MMRLIRWQGLVAFLAVTIIFSVFWFLFVDRFVKRGIEKTGTEIVGARVNLDAADLSLFPTGLSLARLQITDPDKPMINAVDIERIVLSLDPLNLLCRKVIIEKMAKKN